MNFKKFILILTCLITASAAFAQNIRVTGQVKDAQSGEPVSFVTVIQQGTGNAVSADADGRYAINVPANASLRFSSVGYDEVVVEVAGRNVVDVVMNSDNVLEEAVVSALGITRAAKSLTYAEQVVSSEEIAGNRAANMITSLAGKASGVTVTQSAAGMGGSAKISIRGFRSVNSGNEPLYIINGVPMSSSADVSGDTYGSSGMASFDNGDGIGNLNPDDIESITILKGASASALYGTQAANGVILITTKKGVAGQTRVTFNSTTNFENPVYRHELQNTYGHDASWKSWGSKVSNGVRAADNFFETAHTLTNSLSVQSGNDRNQTYLSYGNTTANSILGKNSKLSRHNITFRNTTKLAENLTLDASVQFIRQYTKNRPTTGGLYHNPVMSVYHFPVDLNLNEYKEKFEVYDMDRNLMVQNWYKPLTANDDENPYWITNRIISEQWRDRAMGSLSLRWDITPKVYLQARASADYSA
ncbi:MAG: TonB-dependent receptor plug domain-containing protein, partial [Bacteroidales bacterium]|nr:TonB-dependent receptor plug domain-containing protein [Bacteroidales bacterium]